MPSVRLLKVVYAAVSFTWVTYWTFRLLAVPAADRNPNPMGLVYCLLLFIAIPTFGYFVLFRFVPWATRSLRRS